MLSLEEKINHFFVLNLSNKHFIPIYICKPQSQLKVVITDSRGQIIGDKLKACLEKAFNNAFIYWCNKPRQQDYHNCSVFAIRDIIQMSKNPNFLQFIEDDATLSKNVVLKQNTLYTFNVLPPYLMKSSQLLFQSLCPSVPAKYSLEEYINQLPVEERKLKNSKGQEEDFDKTWLKSTYSISPDQGLHHFYIDQRRYKYQAMIIRDVIGQGALKNN
jgi:hypothetical protein